MIRDPDAGDTRTITRRTALRTAAGAVSAGVVAGTAGTAAAQDGVDYGGWFGASTGGETKNFDGTVDRTGQDSVTVEVGAEGNGGPYAFGPAAVRVDPGTTVTFEWVSDTHNILIEERPSDAGWGGHEAIENSGFTHEHTFETEGIYKYYCQPHLALGMKGAVVVGGGGDGGDGGGGGGVPADYGNWFGSETGAETQNFDGTVDRTGQDSITIDVGAEGNGGPYAFEPAAVRIDPGTTVTFEWVSDTHNVLVEEQPSDAGWSGQETIKNAGFTYEHTFETEGVYKYYCQPHLALGMKGAIVVGAAPSGSGGGGGGGDGGGETPAAGGGEGGEAGASPALSLAFRLIGGAVAAALALVLGVTAWVFINYDEMTTGGGTTVEATPTERTPSESVFESGIVRELGHDEYDPYGTATLIVIYVGIITLMWVFMYFVEFLGGGPTVIG